MMEINCGKTSRVHVTLELLDGNRRWKIFSLAAHFVIVNLYRHDVAHGGERSMEEGKRRADMPTSRAAQFFDNSNHDRHNSAWPISYFLRVPWNFPSRPNNSDFVTELASHSTECRRVARLRARKTRTLSDTLSLIIWGWRASQTWSALKNNENRARVRMPHLNSNLSKYRRSSRYYLLWSCTFASTLHHSQLITHLSVERAYASNLIVR